MTVMAKGRRSVGGSISNISASSFFNRCTQRYAYRTADSRYVQLKT